MYKYVKWPGDCCKEAAAHPISTGAWADGRFSTWLEAQEHTAACITSCDKLERVRTLVCSRQASVPATAVPRSVSNAGLAASCHP